MAVSLRQAGKSWHRLVVHISPHSLHGTASLQSTATPRDLLLDQGTGCRAGTHLSLGPPAGCRMGRDRPCPDTPSPDTVASPFSLMLRLVGIPWAAVAQRQPRHGVPLPQRARVAQGLLEGVRGGQTLGALASALPPSRGTPQATEEFFIIPSDSADVSFYLE